LRLDRLAGVGLLLLVQIALEGDRRRHRRAHGALELRRPGLERGAMHEDRPGDVEVVAQRVEAVELVHAVGHGVGQRIFLRVDAAGGDPLDRLGQVHPHRHRAQELEGALLHLARQHADAQPRKVGRPVHGPYPV
jgi:hypothetical protein